MRTVIFIILMAVNTASVFADTGNPVRVIIGEAAGEGFDGMTAVGEVYRNRIRNRIPVTGSAFSCLSRTNLDAFIKRQGPKISGMAELAWTRSETSGLTAGADHYMTTRLYNSGKRPRWAGKMAVTVVIGDHTFLRSKK